VFVKHTDILDHLLSENHAQFKLGTHTRLSICSDKHKIILVLPPNKLGKSEVTSEQGPLCHNTMRAHTVS